MQEVIDKIENSVEFMIFNGDKKWFLYELNIALNQAIYEFSAFLTGDPATQLQASLHHKSVNQSQNITLLEKSIRDMKVQDLQPTDIVKKLHSDYLKTQNPPLCDKMMEIVKFKEEFNIKIRDLFKKKLMMRENAKKMHSLMKESTTYAIHDRRDDVRKFNRIEKDLIKYKKLEQLYYKDVADFEKILGEGHQVTNEGLDEIQNVIKFDGKNSLKILGVESQKMKVGLTRFIRKLLKVRESIKSDNYMLNKQNKFEKIQDIYAVICGKSKVHQFDPNWPPFEREINDLEHGDEDAINRIHASFHHLINSFDQYYSKELDFSAGFFDTLDRLSGVDSKMLNSLSRFSNSQYKSDHSILDQLLKNFADIRNNLRKVTAKCFGKDSQNCQEMRQVLSAGNEYRTYAYNQLKHLKKKLTGVGNEHMTQEFWKKMSFRLYDYINRVFVKSSNINVSFLDRYDQSIGYTIGKLGKIVSKIEQNIRLCNNPQIALEDDVFKAKVFQQKKTNAEMFRSIIVDERPLIVSEDLKEAGKHKFVYPELDRTVVFRNLKQSQPANLKAGSPPTPNEALKNMVKFSDEAKAAIDADIHSYEDEIKQKFHYKDPNAPEGWDYTLVQSEFFPNRTVEDYINLMCIKRPIKHKGKTYACFRDLHLALQKEVKVSETDMQPSLKTHEKGYGYSYQEASQDKPLPVKLPMAKPMNRMNVQLNHYTMKPSHCIQIMKNHSDDIPSGSEMDMYIVIDIMEKVKNGQKGIQLEYHFAQVWKSSPFLKGLVTKMASNQSKKIVAQTIDLLKLIFRTNPIIPPNATATQAGVQQIGPFEMGNQFEDQIKANRQFRQSIDENFEIERKEIESTMKDNFFQSSGNKEKGLIPDMFGNVFKMSEGDIDDQDIGSDTPTIAENRGKLMVLGAFIMILLKIWFA